MPRRRIADGIWVRDPFDPKSGDYVADQLAVSQVLDWLERERYEFPARRSPDQWTEVSQRKENRTVHAVYQSRSNDGCVEVTYKQYDSGDEDNFEGRPLSPEQAYAIALEQDELRRADGELIYNERHPLPASKAP
jgi:hypothetical protein